jgi:hypothetical protein
MKETMESREDKLDEIWGEAWYYAIACGHPDPDGYANSKVALRAPPVKKTDTGLRQGSRAGRRQAAACRARGQG